MEDDTDDEDSLLPQYNQKYRVQTRERMKWLMRYDRIRSYGEVIDDAVAVDSYLREAIGAGAVFGMNPNPAVPLENPQPVNILEHWDFTGRAKKSYNQTVWRSTKEYLEGMNNGSIIGVNSIGDAIDYTICHFEFIRRQRANGAEFCISEKGDFSDAVRLTCAEHLKPRLKTRLTCD